MKFEGKIVAITGAGQGIGEGIAKAFAKEGAIPVLIGRTERKLKKVSDEIKSEGGQAVIKVCDIGDPEQVKTCFLELENSVGSVDILVNNAAYHVSIPVVETSTEEWLKQIGINLNGTFFCTKAVLPSMIEKKYGKIINISSSAAKHFFPGFGAYAASKGGIVSFTHTLSEEVKHYGINANAIYLGMTNTEHTRERMDTDKAVTIDLESMLQVEEVAEVVMYLSSEEAKPIMGAAIDVFGKKS